MPGPQREENVIISNLWNLTCICKNPEYLLEATKTCSINSLCSDTAGCSKVKDLAVSDKWPRISWSFLLLWHWRDFLHCGCLQLKTWNCMLHQATKIFKHVFSGVYEQCLQLHSLKLFCIKNWCVYVSKVRELTSRLNNQRQKILVVSVLWH